MIKCRHCNKKAVVVFKLHVPYKELIGKKLLEDIEKCHGHNIFLCENHGEKPFIDGNEHIARFVPVIYGVDVKAPKGWFYAYSYDGVSIFYPPGSCIYTSEAPKYKEYYDALLSQ